MRGSLIATCASALALSVPAASTAASDGVRGSILVFDRTAGFHHASIPAAVAALRAIGAGVHLRVTVTDDPAAFTPARLRAYRAVVFLLTTGDVLDASQQAALEGFVRAGGGWMGVHSAADTEYRWPFYGGLVGAYFAHHAPVQPGVVVVVDRSDPSTSRLPARWRRVDEWYSFRTNPTGRVHVLLRLDESSYAPGVATMAGTHPIAWCHRYDGGRAWYTALGHTSASYAEPLFRAHLHGGLLWAAGLVAGCNA